MQIEAQKCTKCLQIYPLSLFHKDKKRKNGAYTYCKFCRCKKSDISEIGLVIPVGMKKCSSCKLILPKSITHFFRRTDSGGYGFRSRCRKCYYEHTKEKKRVYDNLPKNKYTHYKWRYGISLEEVQGLLEKQDNKCLICKRSISIDKLKRSDCKDGQAVLDHEHETKKIRGMLCMRCNAGLGYFMDNPSILSSAIEYLKLTN